MKYSKGLPWFFLLLLSLIVPFFSLFFGAADLSLSDITECLLVGCSDELSSVIFWEIRFPRVMVGFLVGAALSVAGATLQNVTRNGLADPYLFGVVSGAGLGASISTVLIGNMFSGSGEAQDTAYSIALPLAAFLGALLAISLVLVLARTSFGRRVEHMLLAGVAVSFMLSALSHFILYIGDPLAANQVIFWLMGSLARAESWYAWLMLTVVMVSVGLLTLLGPQIDALLMGDQNASTLGVNVKILRIVCLVICAGLSACVVAYCGGIGFVGLMIPHIARRWMGVTSRSLMLACVLLGGIFMVAVDIVARVAVDGQELPIGIITSAIGSVFFLLAMRQRR
ncbi:FecCD family ABC transporter permease [Agaribacter flavus]|uniref:FecCD family ABC transporter permease n=1 Tax=Agaribacter flavus TaxID=1902781 RepID=A0ABV7FWC5_9ALTE